MAVTANQSIARRCKERAGYPIEESTRLYKGTLVFGNEAGYAVGALATDARNRFLGIADDEYDNSSGADGDLWCEVLTDGVFELVGSNFEQGDVGHEVYATDNFTVTKTGGAGKVRIGVIQEYLSSTKVAVRIEPQIGRSLDLFNGAETNTETLSANKTLTSADAAIQVLDPGGSGRDLTLPNVALMAGRAFLVVNTADAAEVITIKNAGGTTICTPTQNESAIVVSNGTTWFGIVGAKN